MLFSRTPDSRRVTHDSDRAERQLGASMVEYTLLVALIAVVAIVSLRELGNATANQFLHIVTELGGVPR
jgi:Flp pilus assembly pilin Flp